jgi:hypothetical protein
MRSLRYLGLPSVVRALRDPLEVQLRQTLDFGVIMVPPYRGSPSIYDCLIH